MTKQEIQRLDPEKSPPITLGPWTELLGGRHWELVIALRMRDVPEDHVLYKGEPIYYGKDRYRIKDILCHFSKIERDHTIRLVLVTPDGNIGPELAGESPRETNKRTSIGEEDKD